LFEGSHFLIEKTFALFLGHLWFFGLFRGFFSCLSFSFLHRLFNFRLFLFFNLHFFLHFGSGFSFHLVLDFDFSSGFSLDRLRLRFDCFGCGLRLLLNFFLLLDSLSICLDDLSGVFSLFDFFLLFVFHRFRGTFVRRAVQFAKKIFFTLFLEVCLLFSACFRKTFSITSHCQVGEGVASPAVIRNFLAEGLGKFSKIISADNGARFDVVVDGSRFNDSSLRLDNFRRIRGSSLLGKSLDSGLFNNFVFHGCGRVTVGRDRRTPVSFKTFHEALNRHGIVLRSL